MVFPILFADHAHPAAASLNGRGPRPTPACPLPASFVRKNGSNARLHLVHCHPGARIHGRRAYSPGGRSGGARSGLRPSAGPTSHRARPALAVRV